MNNTENQVPSTDTVPQQKSTNLLLVIAVTVLVTAVLVGGGVFIFMRNKDTKNDTDSSTSTSSISTSTTSSSITSTQVSTSSSASTSSFDYTGWTTLTMPEFKLQAKVPPGWKVIDPNTEVLPEGAPRQAIYYMSKDNLDLYIGEYFGFDYCLSSTTAPDKYDCNNLKYKFNIVGKEYTCEFVQEVPEGKDINPAAKGFLNCPAISNPANFENLNIYSLNLTVGGVDSEEIRGIIASIEAM